MAKKQPKVLRLINVIKRGARSLLGKELSETLNKKAVGAANLIPVPSMKKGGVVKKTGRILAHKGEIVLTVGQRKALKKLLH